MAAILDRVALRDSDFRAGCALRLTPDGDKVAGQVTLDNCGFAFTSELYRVARLQYSLYHGGGRRVGVSDELVAYDSPIEAAAALAQWRNATAHCPRRLVHSTIAGMPPLHERVTYNASRVRSLPNANNTITVESLAARGIGTRWAVAVLQVRGRILDAVYLTMTSRPTPDEIAAATNLAAITGRRLAAT
jgi:hypothetical protein